MGVSLLWRVFTCFIHFFCAPEALFYLVVVSESLGLIEQALDFD